MAHSTYIWLPKCIKCVEITIHSSSYIRHSSSYIAISKTLAERLKGFHGLLQFLPVEIKLDILTRVPAETVLDCKSVCSNWLSVVRHPLFSKMHRLNHADDDSGTLGFLACTSDENYIPRFHYFEYNENYDESTTPVQRMKRVNLVTTSEEIRFEGSSNGLICLDDGLDDEYIYICNPITREYVMLPKPKKDTYVGGFGHVSSTGEYKVVGIHIHESGFAQVYVYTLGSGKGWRNLGKFKSEFDILSSWDTAGIVANGAIYWQDIDSEIILTFDLAEEKFSENLSEPPLPQDSGWLNRGIGVLNGFLFVVMGLKGEEDGLNDVWLLKKKIDNHGTEVGDERQSLGWSKEFRVDGANLLAFTKSGGVLDSDNRHLNIYDTKTSTKKTLVKFKNFISTIYPHKNTLVSLKELGEEDTKTMESVGIEETRSGGQLQEDADADPEFIFS